MSLVMQFFGINSNRSAEVTGFVRSYAGERVDVYACGGRHRQRNQNGGPARPIVVLKNRPR